MAKLENTDIVENKDTENFPVAETDAAAIKLEEETEIAREEEPGEIAGISTLLELASERKEAAVEQEERPMDAAEIKQEEEAELSEGGEVSEAVGVSTVFAGILDKKEIVGVPAGKKPAEGAGETDAAAIKLEEETEMAKEDESGEIPGISTLLDLASERKETAGQEEERPMDAAEIKQEEEAELSEGLEASEAVGVSTVFAGILGTKEIAGKPVDKKPAEDAGEVDAAAIKLEEETEIAKEEEPGEIPGISTLLDLASERKEAALQEEERPMDAAEIKQEEEAELSEGLEASEAVGVSTVFAGILGKKEIAGEPAGKRCAEDAGEVDAAAIKLVEETEIAKEDEVPEIPGISTLLDLASERKEAAGQEEERPMDAAEIKQEEEAELSEGGEVPEIPGITTIFQAFGTKEIAEEPAQADAAAIKLMEEAEIAQAEEAPEIPGINSLFTHAFTKKETPKKETPVREEVSAFAGSRAVGAVDNFRVIYCILCCLENAMDLDAADPELLSAQSLGISEQRRVRLFEMLIKKGYVEGARVVRGGDGNRVVFSDVQITYEGLEYLQENPLMQKAALS